MEYSAKEGLASMEDDPIEQDSLIGVPVSSSIDSINFSSAYSDLSMSPDYVFLAALPNDGLAAQPTIHVAILNCPTKCESTLPVKDVETYLTA